MRFLSTRPSFATALTSRAAFAASSTYNSAASYNAASIAPSPTSTFQPEPTLATTNPTPSFSTNSATLPTDHRGSYRSANIRAYYDRSTNISANSIANISANISANYCANHHAPCIAPYSNAFC